VISAGFALALKRPPGIPSAVSVTVPVSAPAPAVGMESSGLMAIARAVLPGAPELRVARIFD